MNIQHWSQALPLEDELAESSNEVLEKVNKDHLLKTISQLQNLGNRCTWAKQWKAARWIASEFQAFGLQATLHTYDYNDNSWPNVIAKIEGSKSPEQIIMFIAHLDSVSGNPGLGSPGADDDGSGVAVLLEVSRILSKVTLDRTVIFSAFSNEEASAQGSKIFAHEQKEKKVNILAVINLDILGYNKPSGPLYMDAIRAHQSLNSKFKAILKMVRNYAVGLLRGKDVVIVAGRQENRALVQLTSEVFNKYADLGTRELVRDHWC